MTDTDDRRTITPGMAADMIDHLHAAPDGYHDGMADPAYALSSAGGVVVWWAGPTTRAIAHRNAILAAELYESGELETDDDETPEDVAWDLIARDPALEDLEVTVAEAVERGYDSLDGAPPADRAGYDDLEYGADAARQWFRHRGLDRIADTVIVERGVWTRGPRITFRALGW